MKIIKNLLTSIMMSLIIISPLYASNTLGTVTTQSQQSKLTPEQALTLLKEGNERMLRNKLHHFNLSSLAAKTAVKGQHPIAVVLSCIDSRSSPDILFNQGVGNIFVTRTAGNVVGKKILAGMEFSTKFSGAPLIVVMGHTHCGAIGGACVNLESGNLTHLLQQIQPAVSQIKTEEKTAFNCKKPQTIDAIAKQNVLDQMQIIIKDSPSIAKLVKEKKVMIVGAMHDLATGKVVFFDGKGRVL